ncbi:MAG: hypothetical protein HY720_07370 [Planctomycetes bacterium]|nr:hypothetical protein [Planctomycetota bacterium]
MAQRIAIVLLALVAAGASFLALVERRERDRQSGELRGQLADLREANRRAESALSGERERLAEVRAASVPRADFEALSDRYRDELARGEVAATAQGDRIRALAEEMAVLRGELAALRKERGELAEELAEKKEILARMEGDRLDVIRQIVELERLLAAREEEMGTLETRVEKQDALLEELQRMDREQAEKLRALLEKLQNRN